MVMSEMMDLNNNNNNNNNNNSSNILDNVSADIKKEFDSDPVYNEEFSKTKIKFHGHAVTDFCYKEIPKVNSNHTCLAVIRLDSDNLSNFFYSSGDSDEESIIFDKYLS